MKIVNANCPRYILADVPFPSRAAALLLQEGPVSHVELLSKSIGRSATVRFLKHVSKKGHAEISRVRCIDGKSAFALVVHYGTMGCDSYRSTKCVRVGSTKIPFPFNPGFSRIRHFQARIKTPEKSKPKVDHKLEIFKLSVVKFLKQQKVNHPDRIINMSDTSITAGANTIRQLMDIDGWKMFDIEETINWCIMDEFWTTNIFSIAPLRKKSSANGNTKFENMRNSYVESNKGKSCSSEFSKVSSQTVEV